ASRDPQYERIGEGVAKQRLQQDSGEREETAHAKGGERPRQPHGERHTASHAVARTQQRSNDPRGCELRTAHEQRSDEHCARHEQQRDKALPGAAMNAVKRRCHQLPIALRPRHRECAPPPQVAELRAKTTLFARSSTGPGRMPGSSASNEAGCPDPVHRTTAKACSLQAVLDKSLTWPETSSIRMAFARTSA